MCAHPPPLSMLFFSNLAERGSTCGLVDGCSTLIRYRKDNRINTLWLNVILKKRKENVLQSEPWVPFTEWFVYNTVLWWFCWWYLYSCKHFSDPVISGFYKPWLFLKLSLPLDSFLERSNCCNLPGQTHCFYCSLQSNANLLSSFDQSKTFSTRVSISLSQVGSSWINEPDKCIICWPSFE